MVEDLGTILTKHHRFPAKTMSIELDFGFNGIAPKYNMSYYPRMVNASYASRPVVGNATDDPRLVVAPRH
jgi:hypothetical protein